MKRSIFFFALLFYLFSNQLTIHAAGTTSTDEHSVYDSIQKGEGKSSTTSTKVEDNESPSIFPLFIKFIFSFILVIGLLIVLLRFLSKRNRLMQSNGLVLPLGGHVLGNNRSLQVVLIGQTIYILGIGETVTMIRSISQGEEYQHLLESYENQADGNTPNWLAKDSIKHWNAVFRKQMKKMQKENREE